MQYRLILILIFYVVCPLLALAQPYHPQQDGQILETLPAQGKAWLEIRGLRDRVNANPNDLQSALNLVKRYIELGRAESDPRYYGYAEAVLAPWLQTAHSNAEVLTLRATLFQNRHEFPAALENLNVALMQQPRLAQAWLTKASILEVQGQYAAALNNCRPLLKLASPLTAKVCINSALSLSGQLDTAYAQLKQALELAGNESIENRQWALTTLAEIAERKGDAQAAEQHYQQAFQLEQPNGYLLSTYADFLLEHRRYGEVISRLQAHTRIDGLLLRLTIAEQHLQAPTTAAHIAALQDRFAASRMRGDKVHQGDESRFMLHLLKLPQPALDLALLNWSVQHEPRDARVLLEAAIAAGNNHLAVQPAIDFLTQASVQDARLAPLIKQFQGGV